MDDLVHLKQEALSAGRDKPVSYEEAYSEVIADSMEAMLSDGNVLEKLAELKQQDEGLVRKMKAFFDNFVKKIRSIYADLKPESAEGQLVLEMKDQFEQLQQLFAEALADAGENYRNAAEVGMEVDDIVKEYKRDRKDVQFSVRNGLLTKDTTELERYNLLKDVKLVLATPKTDRIAHVNLEDYNTRRKSAVIPGFKLLAKKLGISNVDWENSHLDFPFQFSGKGIEVSAHHQLEYGGTYQDYVLAMSCFDELIKNAVPIEVHGEKKTGTVRAIADLKQVYVLVSAYKDNGFVIPVQFEIKEYVSRDARLYLMVTLTKIKEPEVLETSDIDHADNPSPLFSSSAVSLQYIFSNVNVEDRRFLKYVPDGFLNADQKQAKERALNEQQNEYSGYGASVQKQDRASAPITNRALLANALESTTQDETELTRLREYRMSIDYLNEQEAKLTELNRQIREISFGKGPRDTARLKQLQEEATKTANRINVADKKLLRLEAAQPLQRVLERERGKAYRQAQNRNKEVLARRQEGRNKTAA